MANILSVSDTAATSSDVTLADGASANLVLMVSSGVLSTEAEAIVYADSSGVDVEVYRLNHINRSQKVTGPGTYRVVRPGGYTFGIDSL